MTRFAVRKAVRSSAATSIATAAALGLGLGLAAGFVIGELAGPVTARALRKSRPRRESYGHVSGLVDAAQAALNDDLLLRDCRLRVLGVGPGRIELHGWVEDRRSRARAAHLVSDAIEADAIINCLLVRGEDDGFPDDSDDDADERRA